MVGMILGSSAHNAGVAEGDQVLQIDNVQVDGQSPFQAASAISGGDAESDTVTEPIVRLQVRHLSLVLVGSFFFFFIIIVIVITISIISTSYDFTLALKVQSGMYRLYQVSSCKPITIQL